MLKEDQRNLDFFKRRGIINGLTYYGFIVTAVISILAAATLPYLSFPPNRGIENRQYSECKGNSASRENCLLANGEVQQNYSVESGHYNERAKSKPNDFIKEKRDLTAQEGMWRATNLVAFYAFFQVIAGLAGVVLIGWTLLYTRKAMESAALTLGQAKEATLAAVRTAEAAEAAEKAYLFIEFENEVEEGARGKYDSRAFVYIRLSNYGHTPAKNVVFEYTYSEHGVGDVPIWPAPAIRMRYVPVQHPVKVVGPSSRDIRVRLASLDFPTIAGNGVARTERLVAARVSYDTVFYDRSKFDGRPEVIEESAFRLIPKGFTFESNKRTFLSGFHTFVNYNFNSVDGVEFEEVSRVEFVTREEFEQEEAAKNS